jgi:hypothetical protein
VDENPWHRLPDGQPFVLPEDKDKVQAFPTECILVGSEDDLDGNGVMLRGVVKHNANLVFEVGGQRLKETGRRTVTMKSCQRLRFFSLFLLVLGLAGTAAWAEEKPVADADLARWIDKRVEARQPPAADKRFDEIGWAHDIRTALALAKEHDRPIFLFTHDGRINTGRC